MFQASEALEELMALLHANITRACQEYLEQYRRQLHVTPKSYLAFLDTFCELFTSKSTTLRDLAASLTTGLRKLDEAKVDVSVMKVGFVIKHTPVVTQNRHHSHSWLRAINTGRAATAQP